MDGSKVIDFKKPEESLCQFYVILGNRDFRPPKDHNVYINATGVRDFNLIKSSILKNWQKQRKIMQVSDKIIYIIPGEEYRDQASEIIRNTGFNGEVQVFVPQVVDEVNSLDSVVNDSIEGVNLENKNTYEDDTFNVEKAAIEEVNTVNEVNVDKTVKIVDMAEYQSRLSGVTSSAVDNSAQVNEKKNDYSYKPNVYKPDIPIYHGDGTDIPVATGGTSRTGDVGKDSAMYPGYNQTLINQNVKKMVKVKGVRGSNKSAAFVSLPVVIFVLSSLLLIASIILLFVIE